MMHDMEEIRAVATSPSGELVAYGAGTQVRIEDAETGELRFTLDREVGDRPVRIEALDWLPDGWHLAAQWRGERAAWTGVGLWSLASGVHRLVEADLTSVPAVAKAIGARQWIGGVTAPIIEGQWSAQGELFGTCRLATGDEVSGIWQVDPTTALAILIGE